MIDAITGILKEIHFRYYGRFKRFTFSKGLKQVYDRGFRPGTVIDVGAAYGTFELYDAFPSSNHFLIEPLEEYKPFLEKLSRENSKIEHKICAVSSVEGELEINVHPDLTGSSLYVEDEDSDVNGVPRKIPVFRLDKLCINKPGPYLLKVDVQGAELDVLEGAAGILDNTEYIILETTMFGTFKNGPQLSDVVEFMKKKGFVVYDIFGNTYRMLDDALNQVDLAFVKENGMFRRDHAFATADQRIKKNKRMKLMRKIRSILKPRI